MITYILIGITVLTSFSAFSNAQLVDKCLFYPYGMKEPKEWYRFFSHGFIHADAGHLIFNMIALFCFGRQVESTFEYLFGTPVVYPLYYLSALVFSSLPSFVKHKNDAHYSALGASGAISAVLFSAIIFDPWQTLLIKFIIPVPAILFAIGYIVYSQYMSKKGTDNIGHDAHLYGALYGLIFPIVFKPYLISYFLDQIQHPRFLH